MAVFGDRRASFRGFDRIETIAQKARAIGRLSGHSQFNIADYVTGAFRLSLKVRFDLELFDKATHSVPAFVESRDDSNVLLHVEKITWRNAQADFSEPRYIIAHEIGHIIMHAHDKLAYSSITPASVAKLPAEDRTEPQANLFADLFLVPTEMLKGFSRAEDVADFFNVPMHCAARRFEAAVDRRRRQRAPFYDGESCPECANFTLVRNGTCLKCDTCGSTTGCS